MINLTEKAKEVVATLRKGYKLKGAQEHDRVRSIWVQTSFTDPEEDREILTGTGQYAPIKSEDEEGNPIMVDQVTPEMTIEEFNDRLRDYVCFQAEPDLTDLYQYQANSIKARLLETAIITTPDCKDKVMPKLAEYRNEQPTLYQGAKDLEQQRDTLLHNARIKLKQRDECSFAGISIQMAIVCASLAAMTKKQGLFYLTVLITVLSLFLSAYVVATTYLIK